MGMDSFTTRTTGLGCKETRVGNKLRANDNTTSTTAFNVAFGSQRNTPVRLGFAISYEYITIMQQQSEGDPSVIHSESAEASDPVCHERPSVETHWQRKMEISLH